MIAAITEGVDVGPEVQLGPGDDAAVITSEAPVAISTDILVEDVHFRRAWSEPEHIGRKAVAVNVSDIEAMGARPQSIVMALAVPHKTDPGWIEAVSRGAREECSRAGISLVGGDLSSAQQIVVCGTALGSVDKPITRDGAQPGEIVAICGNLGISAAGLLTLQRGFRAPGAAINEYRCPSVPYGQGAVAARIGATAMLDVSDGLIQDLGHICRASQVGIDINPDQIEVPEVVERVCAATGKNPQALMLAGGEDYCLAATFPAKTELPPQWRTIGVVTTDQGVTLGGQVWESEAGWDHFR